MLIKNAFQVPVPVERAWPLFTDVTRIAPCMPGAEITSVEDGRYQGQAQVKLGPVTLRFSGEARFTDVDEASRTVTLAASGRDRAGRGTARALVTSRLVPQNGATLVEVETDLQLSGAVAQFGRQGIVSDVSSALIRQFAECLRVTLTGAEQQEHASEASAQPVSALPLLLHTLRTAAARLLRRLADQLDPER